VTPEQIAGLIKDEDEAFKVVHALEARFGWAGTFFTRQDAESQWENDLEATEMEGAEFTDAMWEILRHSKAWNRYVASTMTDAGWEGVSSALSDMQDYLNAEMKQETI